MIKGQIDCSNWYSVLFNIEAKIHFTGTCIPKTKLLTLTMVAQNKITIYLSIFYLNFILSYLAENLFKSQESNKNELFIKKN